MFWHVRSKKVVVYKMFYTILLHVIINSTLISSKPIYSILDRSKMTLGVLSEGMVLKRAIWRLMVGKSD